MEIAKASEGKIVIVGNMGLKSSKSGVLPGYLCCPSKWEEFCENLTINDRDDTIKRKDLNQIIENTIRGEVEPYVGKLFLVIITWDGQKGAEEFVKNIAKNNEEESVLAKLFKSLLLMYGRDCILINREPPSRDTSIFIWQCLVELFKGGFSSRRLLHEGSGVCWSIDGGEIHAGYCRGYTAVACWGKYIQLIIQATHNMHTMHAIWSEVSQHLAYCSHVPSAHFRTQCQYALFIQGYNHNIWKAKFRELSESVNPAYRHMVIPKTLIDCCVAVIRSRLKGPNVFYAIKRMPVLPKTIQNQLLLTHLFPKVE